MWAIRCGWSNTIIIKYNLSVLLYSKESKAIIWHRDEVCSSGFKLALSSEFATRIIFQVFAHWSLLRLLDTLVRIFFTSNWTHRRDCNQKLLFWLCCPSANCRTYYFYIFQLLQYLANGKHRLTKLDPVIWLH